MTEVAEARRKIIDNVRKEIHGPVVTDRGIDLRQLLVDSPDQTFSCGILYPQKTLHADHDEPNEAQDFSDEEDSFNLPNISIPTRGNSERDAQDNEEQYLDDLDLSAQLRPSAMSISFRVRDCSNLNLRFYFATYSPETVQDKNGVSRGRYKRRQHRIYWQVELDKLSSIYKEKKLFFVDKENKKSSLIGSLMARSAEGSERSVTISIVNKIEIDQSSRTDYRSMFFQPQLVAKTGDGNFVPVESSGNFGEDEELSELNLQYRELNSYCRGHGCAGEWRLDHGSTPTRVHSNLIPGYEVPGTAARTTPLYHKNKLSFSFKDFSRIDTNLNEARTNIIKKLEPFCNDYADWLSDQANLSNDLDEIHSAPSARILGRIELTLDRMRLGIKKITEDDDCLKSFILANRAMWLQQCHVKEEPRFLDKKFDNPTIDLDQRDDKGQPRGWRPFQLAFLLINLYSIPTLGTPTPVDTDTVDLIWFPTGGGKTEAYLGLAAYSIVLSRLKNKTHSRGTEVLMRYTLRLLTGQQFQRATALICALEFLRKHEKNYSWEIDDFTKGEEISIGLWVGRSLTPNKNADAVSTLKKLRQEKDGVKNPFQMFNCPWCKSDLEFASSIDKAANKKTFHGYEISGTGKSQIVNFVCHDKDCCFDVLPIMVVDEQLYRQPPTLLIGTVDKFAQLSWLDETGNFFACKQKEVPPPSLIIQDELHLISGPLGSIVAHYEYLLRAIFSYSGFQPKIIASTATIRSASDQVQKLFASKVNIFPAPGLNYDDNYFSFTEPAGLGRYYVGIFASATPSVVTAERNLAATLLQMPKLFFDNEKYIKVNYPENPDDKIKKEIITYGAKDPGIDPYGTLVWYFNSIRELGYAKTLLVQDIAEHFKVLQRRYQISWQLVGIKSKIEELTSRADEEEIGSIERNLKTEWSPFPDFSKKENIPIDVLLATNMISVGFDIDRLGLMLINGQPKNTAEYIQASSRVGRGTKGSGLVYTLYNHSRSRDRSHFENFFSYHQALYRNVEPTSITPMSPKARERSLPGLIIGLARHVLGLKMPRDLDDKGIEKIKSLLLPYLKDADDFSSKLGSDNVIDEISRILDFWYSKVNSDEGDHLTWGSMGNTPDETDLTMPFGTTIEQGFPSKIPLLMSMRNVDGESRGSLAFSSLSFDTEGS